MGQRDRLHRNTVKQLRVSIAGGGRGLAQTLERLARRHGEYDTVLFWVEAAGFDGARVHDPTAPHPLSFWRFPPQMTPANIACANFAPVAWEAQRFLYHFKIQLRSVYVLCWGEVNLFLYIVRNPFRKLMAIHVAGEPVTFPAEVPPALAAADWLLPEPLYFFYQAHDGFGTYDPSKREWVGRSVFARRQLYPHQEYPQRLLVFTEKVALMRGIHHTVSPLFYQSGHHRPRGDAPLFWDFLVKLI